MDEFNYTLVCPSCEVSVELKVYVEDELPVYCSMCGEDVNEEWTIAD
jgi:Zn ribbon nucleic-acid-binding protein